MAKQISYFAPGPGKIPKEVLEEMQRELIHYKDTHVSVMELSHRSQDFAKILKKTEDLVKEVLDIPNNYKILFLQGGGTGQFAAIPLNLISRTGKADYVVTGSWTSKAAKECEKYGDVHLVLPPVEKHNRIPPQEEWSLSPDASYVYYCVNETLEGIEYDFIPEVPEGVPLVCDMSSNFGGRAVDVSKYGLIFATAQKNIGCAGATVVIVREDLLGSPLKECPSILNYTLQHEHGTMYNTPPTYAIYVVACVLSWIKRNGGVRRFDELSTIKSEMLYSIIDQNDQFYFNSVPRNNRSRMNVTYFVGCPKGNEGLQKRFLEEADEEGLLLLVGHRHVGGIRASIYNAISVEDVERLSVFMKAFVERYKDSELYLQMKPQ